ncbi:MAG TPA: hypothetical protein VGG48_10285 [Rhizomicrobium sp.]|jgi:hypothetical protein
MRSSSDSYSSPLAIALGAFLLGGLVAVAGQFLVSRVVRQRRRFAPSKIDELMVNRRYQPRPTTRLTQDDDPWEHYEEVLG